MSCKENKEAGDINSLADQVVLYYNQSAYDSIFHLYSQEMKAQLPSDQSNAFFSQLKKDAGPLEKHDLVTTKDGMARYRASFQQSMLWMDISQNRYGKIDGLLFTPYDGPVTDTVFRRNKTSMALPFKGEWFVFWGGDTPAENYHVISKAQRHAFDLVMTDKNGKTFRSDGKTNEDYYAFGQPLLAPCAAEVVQVIDGVKDNTPGEMNPSQLTGNTVILRTAANEYLLFAHFKLNSIKVAAGDTVKQGQILGLCGNSGNSSEPHLHFHIQDHAQMEVSTGIKCFFESLIVNGVEKKDHSPVKGELIRNK